MTFQDDYDPALGTPEELNIEQAQKFNQEIEDMARKIPIYLHRKKVYNFTLHTDEELAVSQKTGAPPTGFNLRDVLRRHIHLLARQPSIVVPIKSVEVTMGDKFIYVDYKNPDPRLNATLKKHFYRIDRFAGGVITKVIEDVVNPPGPSPESLQKMKEEQQMDPRYDPQATDTDVGVVNTTEEIIKKKTLSQSPQTLFQSLQPQSQRPQ